MTKSIYQKGIEKLIREGPREFLTTVRWYILARLIARIDRMAKNHLIFGNLLVLVFGLLHKEIIVKTGSYYIRYTPFGDNMFGQRKYYFPDLKHHRQIERFEYHDQKYFSNERVFIKPTDTVVELGAARGVTTQIAANRGKRIIAFEPSPRGFECLARNITADNVELYQYAAWNEPDELEMNYGEQSGDDSLIAPNSGAWGVSEKVRADRIENFAQELGIEEVDFLKVEVEGAEPEVIDGIGDLPVDRIVVNCSNERYGESPFEEVTSLLQGMGYSIIAGSEGGRVFAVKE